jgi:GntR family transcriptional regulator, transcriptional repressor for pyruvate dehydrogenase complex
VTLGAGSGTDGSPRAWIFQAMHDPRMHERVVDQITFAIRSGAYGVGDRLPSVEQMASEMQVSKPTVGEAIRVLSEFGVVQSRRGVHGGVTVVSDNIPTTLLMLTKDPGGSSLRELLEARRPIEMEIARRAAERASTADLDSMQASIDRLVAEPAESWDVRLRFDHFFHYAMGRAARSDLLAYYQHQVLEGITVLAQDYFRNVEDPAVVADLHRRTLDAIRGGAVPDIDRAMDEHLAYLERALEEPAHDAATDDGAAA